ncbi:KilA-N domain-containing protein [Ignavigranum ruoffiae]|uniref:KilA-N domain-containing protein n=1 Tax=Ignavigranum ruoffiae TaxID=89093 RepID=UPI003D156B8D
MESTNAIGIVSKSGRYGGTYAHSDIAMELAYWISAEFELYIIKLFLILKYLTNGNRRPNDEMER